MKITFIIGLLIFNLQIFSQENRIKLINTDNSACDNSEDPQRFRERTVDLDGKSGIDWNDPTDPITLSKAKPILLKGGLHKNKGGLLYFYDFATKYNAR